MSPAKPNPVTHATGDDALLAAFFDEARDLDPPALPSAGRLWWRAEILARLDEEKRRSVQAARPVRWATASSVLAILVAVSIIVVRAGGSSPDEGSSLGWLLLGLFGLVPTAIAAVATLFGRRT